ncbi:MAG: hypothetical protein LLG14_20390 [Nocardiaceae bacterium]|nr:hypothetical protein [Nocardiaceae bacterium]
MSDPAMELAEELTIAVRDVTFNTADLEAWIAGRARNESELLAAAVFILAAWAPDDEKQRHENAARVIWEHANGQKSEWCSACGDEMADRKKPRPPGVKSRHSKELCQSCFNADWRQRKGMAS